MLRCFSGNLTSSTTLGSCPTVSPSLRLCVHGGEPRRPYFQVPMTDAENYLRLLLLPDVDDFSDADYRLFVVGVAQKTAGPRHDGSHR